MTDQLAEVAARLHAVRQVGAVVNAMRGMAGSRAQQAHQFQPAVRAYAEVGRRAIEQALRLGGASGREESRSGRADAAPVLIVFGAEAGFAGGFADRVLEAAAEVGDASWLLVGSRTAALAHERGLAITWETNLPARAAALPALAGDLAEALYRHIAERGASRVDMLTPVWEGAAGLRFERRPLLPLDLAALAPGSGQPPLTTIPDAVLLARLSEEYVYACICEAAVEAYAAENQARVNAMASARSKIDEQLGELQQLEHRVRQEAITAEVVELSARSRR
jgi:F-type H+-transporting ATPase subunit gamma